jgi:hypothetical protein
MKIWQKFESFSLKKPEFTKYQRLGGVGFIGKITDKKKDTTSKETTNKNHSLEKQLKNI